LHVHLRVDNADLMCRAFSFLRTNKALKSLISWLKNGAKPCIPAFNFNIAAMLQENTSLETLSIRSGHGIDTIAEEYLVFIAALEHNPRRSNSSIV
jgi:hypothetical protein